MIYLLHFAYPYKHAKHYLGYVDSSEGLDARLARHRAGGGARLIEVITQAGISFEVAATWEGDRHYERRLKKRGGAAKICPICKEEKRKEKP